ncbi:hypothetical protein AX774_g173 [Zancudomyces culisetae]|uniref:Uncharacterized protein n=1 Tax=Zancudomyces culisetae TaxID=1213189 RepID=A0A1R1PZA4_ZANCU|nr:hypothetical protein AX774_g173 [Zancudomyces culisetae]|eukprot:OMH86281.1 hypothetical protein AX774_g173 [Zancudomyces culisetae]
MNNFTLHNQNIAGVSGFSDGNNSNTKSNGVYKSKRKSLTDFKDNVGGERSIETTPKSLLKSSYNQNKVERGNRLGVETEM